MVCIVPSNEDSFLISEVLKEWEIEAVRFDKTMNNQERQIALSRFNSKKARVLVATDYLSACS